MAYSTLQLLPHILITTGKLGPFILRRTTCKFYDRNSLLKVQLNSAVLFSGIS